MIYIKTFEKFNNDIIDRLKTMNEPFEVFNKEVMSLSQEDKNTILEYVKNFNESGMILYHSTDKHKQIEDEGLKLTKGLRSHNFMGGVEYYVQNLGIFLSDNKYTAKFFGRNRAEYHNKHHVLFEYVVNINNILDFTKKVPNKFHKLGTKLLNDYHGGNRTRIAQSDIFWCLDRPDFVNLIKQEGYDAVKFLEDPEAKKGHKKSCTYFVMDINKIKRKIITMRDLYNHLYLNR